MTLENARRAARFGGFAAFATAALTLIAAGLALYNGQGGPFENNFVAFVQDPIFLLDVALVVVLGIFMLRMGRVAALVMFTYFLVTKILQFAVSMNLGSLLVALVFLYFYGNAVRGTFTYHKRMREADPSYRGARAWHFATGIPVVMVVVGITGSVAVIQAGLLEAPQEENILTNKVTPVPPPDPVEEIKTGGTMTNTMSQDGTVKPY